MDAPISPPGLTTAPLGEPRILFLTQRYPPIFGGGGAYLKLIHDSIRESGFASIVLAGHRGVPGGKGPGIYRLPSLGGKSFPRLDSYLFALMTVPALFFLRRRYDLIHTIGNAHYAYLGILVGRLLGKPVIVASVQNRGDDPSGIVHERFGRLKNSVFSRAAGYVCCSGLQVDAYREASYPAAKVRFIPNGINPSRFIPCPDPEARASLRRRLGLPSEGPVVVSTGGIDHRKGIDLLVEAWALYRRSRPQGTLVLVGPHRSDEPGSDIDAAFVTSIKEQIARSGTAGSVIFTGRVENVPEYLRAADIFVLMSRSEGFPVAILEAMATGLPCVLWDLPDYRGYGLQDGVNALLIPPFDVARLAAALERLEFSGETRDSIGRAGKSLTARFTLAASVEAHISLYRELASSQGATCRLPALRARPAEKDRPINPSPAPPTGIEPTRVGLVIGQLHAGGVERQLFELAPRMLGGPCEPFVYCLSDVLEPFGADLARAGVPPRVIIRRRSYEPKRVLALARLLREDRIDVVHALSPTTNLYAFLALRLAGHRPLISSNFATDPTCGRFTALVSRFVFQRSQRVMVNSEAGRVFTARFYCIPLDRIEVIPYGVDPRRFESLSDPVATRTALGVTASAPLAGIVGRVSWEKGVDLFLEVARIVSARLPEARFVVVGDGPILSEMRLKAASLGIAERVIFTGFRSDIPELLSAMDLLVLTSSQEGMPNAVLEAMAAGRPVVATDVGGCRELIVEGVTGYLSGVDDRQGLAERVNRILASSDRGRALGEAGRRRAIAEFSIDAMARRSIDLYLRLHREERERTAPGAP